MPCDSREGTRKPLSTLRPRAENCHARHSWHPYGHRFGASRCHGCGKYHHRQRDQLAVSPTTSNARVQEFNDDITSTINTGIAVDGWGLALVTDKTDGTITITNDGSITVNDPGADALAALLLNGTGASIITYSDTTTSSISNDATNTPNSNGLVFQNATEAILPPSRARSTGRSVLRLSAVRPRL